MNGSKSNTNEFDIIQKKMCLFLLMQNLGFSYSRKLVTKYGNNVDKQPLSRAI